METIISSTMQSATDPMTTAIDPATIVTTDDSVIATPSETGTSKAKTIVTTSAMIGGGITGGILLGYFVGKEAAKRRARELEMQNNAAITDACRDVDNDEHQKAAVKAEHCLNRITGKLNDLTAKLKKAK